MSNALTPAPPAPPEVTPGWLDPALFPFSPKEFCTPQGTLRYLDEGAGRPVLLVHGTPSWSFEWRAQVAALSKTHRVIAPDHLGFGRSDKPTDPAVLRPEDHAARLLALVDALDLHDITLVLHDFGGPIGAPVALDRPARVRAVVVMNTWMWAHGDAPRIRWMSWLVGSALGRWLYLRLNASPRWLVPSCFGDRRVLTARVHAHYLGPFAREASRVSAWTLGVRLAASDPFYASLWDRRGALGEKLTQVLWGMADPAFGADYLARWREGFPRATVTTLPGVGHFPQEEAPDAVLEAIRRA
jgi:pimeloyl-ACP methyl ester carboxylesterase